MLCLKPKSALHLAQMEPRWKGLSPGACPVCSSSSWTFDQWGVGVVGSPGSPTPLSVGHVSPVLVVPPSSHRPVVAGTGTVKDSTCSDTLGKLT